MPRYDDRDDDYEDDDDLDVRRPKRRKAELNWLDQQFLNTNIVVLVLFSFCCGWIALIFGILGVCICTDSKARTNAGIVLTVSAVMVVLSVLLQLVRMALPPGPGHP